MRSLEQRPPHFLLARPILPVRPVATVSIYIRQATVIRSKVLKLANKHYRVAVDALTAWEGDTSVGIVAPQSGVHGARADIIPASVRVRNALEVRPTLRQIQNQPLTHLPSLSLPPPTTFVPVVQGLYCCRLLEQRSITHPDHNVQLKFACFWIVEARDPTCQKEHSQGCH